MIPKDLKPGEKKKLTDGRTITFLEVNIDAMDDPCEGCAFDNENCASWYMHTGACGTGRDDGKLGIFVECKEENDG